MATRIKGTQQVQNQRKDIQTRPSSTIMNGLGDRNSSYTKGVDTTSIVASAAQQFMGGAFKLGGALQDEYRREETKAGKVAGLTGQELPEDSSEYRNKAYDVAKAQVDGYDFQVGMDDYTNKAIEDGMTPAEFKAGLNKGIANYVTGKSDEYIIGFQPTASLTTAKVEKVYGDGMMKKMVDKQKSDIRIKTAGIIRNLEAQGTDLNQGDVLREVAVLLQDQYQGDDVVSSREQLFAGGLDQLVHMDKDAVDGEVIETIRAYAIETGQPDLLKGLTSHVDKRSGFGYGTSKFSERLQTGISAATTVQGRKNIDANFDALMQTNQTSSGAIRYDTMIKSLNNVQFLRDNGIKASEAATLRSMAYTAWGQNIGLKSEADKQARLTSYDAIYDMFSGGNITGAIKLLNDDDNIPADQKMTMLAQLNRADAGDNMSYNKLLEGVRSGSITDPTTVLTDPNITVKQSQELRKLIEDIQGPDGDVLTDGIKGIRDGISGGALIKQTPLQALNIQKATTELRAKVKRWREEGKDPAELMQDGKVLQQMLNKYTPSLQDQLDSKLASINAGTKPLPVSFTTMRGYMKAYLKSRGASYDDNAVDRAFDNDQTREYIEQQWATRSK